MPRLNSTYAHLLSPQPSVNGYCTVTRIAIGRPADARLPSLQGTKSVHFIAARHDVR